MVFALGFLATFLLGGVTGIMMGAAAVDIYVHDSYYIVAHFHYTLYPLVFFAGPAGLYHWFPKLWGRLMNDTLGYLHFAGSMLFFNMIFLPQFNLGLMGHHRRIAVPTNYEFLSTDTAMLLQDISTFAVFGLLVSQVPFVVNFFWSMYRGQQAADNPWDATTLEWQCPSPPPHGNFASQPLCYRGPYVYSPPGDGPDFVPQTVPPESPGALPMNPAIDSHVAK
jgi:cytochrome c oxidase subunit 1